MIHSKRNWRRAGQNIIRLALLWIAYIHKPAGFMQTHSVKPG